MTDNLPKEYFDLLRKVMKEKKEGEERKGAVCHTPKRKKRRFNHVEDNTPEIIDLDKEEENKYATITTEVIDLDKEESEGKVGMEDYESEDYESDEFEDVTNPTEDLSITIDNSDPKIISELERKKRRANRNVCSNDEKIFRRHYHMLYLLCSMCHGSIRNDWCNDPKLQKKLTKLIPDKVFDLLHPAKDEELILRSTRKLLDGLKQCMNIWNKHWKIMKSYDTNVGCYMPTWKEIHDTDKNYNISRIKRNSMPKKMFVKQILKGVGNRDIATQGFVALLRSCNVNARLIISCQPPDFTNLKNQNNEQYFDQQDMIKYPIFWCEVWDKFAKKWITIDPTNLKVIEQVRTFSKLEPKEPTCCKRNQIRYVIGFDRKDGCRDITRRYVRYLHSKVRKKRITKDHDGEVWFNKVCQTLNKRKRTKIDDYEDIYFDERNSDEGMPDNLQDFKNHPHYVLEKDIKQNEVVKPGCKECGFLRTTSKTSRILKVYERKDILQLKSARQWYNEGRILKPGCKHKKILKRKSFKRTFDDDEEEERLYCFEDTEIYVPPLATNAGEIRKNAYGNIEVFSPTMIPANCFLIKSPIAIKAAKFLNIEFAPAVTEFKFERGQKVKPVISGVVIAQWYRDAMLAAIDGIEYSIENEKMRETELRALSDWNTLLLKLRIKSNLNATYGSVPMFEENKSGGEGKDEVQNEGQDENDIQNHEDEDMFEGGGGFFIPQTNDNTDTCIMNSSSEEPKSSFGNGSPSLDVHEESDFYEEGDERDGIADVNEDKDAEDGLDDEYEAFMNDIDE